MNPLAEYLRHRIAQEGPISLSEFMGEALGHPEYGYYMSRVPLGEQGDFTTAPEISQMFGELVGLWCAVMWQCMGAPSPFNLVEIGPGRGTLMMDALRASRTVPAYRAAIRPHLVETSPALREEQQKTLAAVEGVAPACWHEALDGVPAGPMIVIANEFFDALPIRQFQRTKDGWAERMLDCDVTGESFHFVLSPSRPDTPPVPRDVSALPEGAVVEIAPLSEGIMRDLASRLVTHGGAALIIDYGYEDGAGETFQAVRDHDFCDPLADPGNADLTAHVDFGALSQVARQAGARVWGPVPQGKLLMGLGIEMRAKTLLDRASPEQAKEIMSAHHRLVHPDEMGVLFKALAVTHPGLAQPPGFEQGE